MPRTKLRVFAAGFLLALFAAVVVLGGDKALGQKPIGIAQPGGKNKDKDKDKKDDGRPPEDESLPFAFPYERDAKNQLEGARAYLTFKDPPWGTICGFLQNILESKSDSFFNTYYTVDGKKYLHRISVKTEANRIIAAFPKEGLQFYQQAYGGAASALLDDAIKANYDIPMLAEVSQRYFHTKAGAEATILLASLYLERGNYLEAAQAFDRLFTRLGAEDFQTPRTLFKAALAFKRSGDPRYATHLKLSLELLRKATEKTGLVLGRQTYTFDKLQAEINRNLELLRITTTVGEWATRGGNSQRSATIDGGPPFLDPTFRSTMFYTGEDEANLWIKNELEKLFLRDAKVLKSVPLPAFFPITTPEMVIFRSYGGVFGIATRDQVVGGRVVRAGDLRWASRTTFGPHQMLSQDDPDQVETRKSVQEWWATYSQAGVTSVLYENPLIGGLSHDGQNVYFIDDVSIPPPPLYSDPNFGGFNQGPQFKQSGQLADAVRAGRLVAVDLKSGMLKWELGRVLQHEGSAPLPARLNEEEADKTTNAFQLCMDAIFLSTPLPLDGKIYTLIEQAGVVRLICLDPRNLVVVPGRPNVRVPALVWTQKLGRPANNLPQDSIRRYQGATLAAGEGIIICPTNSGAIVAVDSVSRSLLWAHAYRKLDPNEPRRQPQFDSTGRMIPPQQLKPQRWRAAGPVIANGRLIMTAYDSDKLECIELRTGKVVWEVPRLGEDLYVGGVVNDRVIVVGQNYVKGYVLAGEEGNNKQPVWTANIPTPTGHGVGGKGVYYVPVRQDNAGRDTIPPAEIWAINVENGNITSKTGARKRNDNSELAKFGIGNLVFQDGMVFAQSAWELACYPQLEQKKNEMNKLLAANPNDPVGLLARGELLLDDGKLKEAIADFAAAQKNNLPPEKQPLLREKKYIAYTELIRSDFAAGEAYLPEYEALCELPIDDSLDPIEKQNRRDETERRKRLSLYLLARGREGQGRLGEAFDKYLALANLGEGKTLLDMPDEPNVRMRPDVWARGRIESMIRKAANPAARKSLEERVGQEWERVKDGRDLKKLREFVSVFGPYFASGAEGQFLLADSLLQTNNENDAREAQTHLAQLRVTADDIAVRARATEALARLMVKNRLMEDAVGLYQQLGKEYADVIVKDGKTGADFMRGLLTDKRLLPYLEPSRYPLPSRVKAEQREPVNMQNNGQFEIEPGGDLFPMYKRYRFVIEMYNPSGNGQWTLRVFDRASGVEKAKFGGLVPPQIYNPGIFPFSRYVQGSGQLLIVQLGTWVYCLDLAEKKERWHKNLLGDPAPGAQPNPPIQQPGADGEVTVRYADNYTVTLGRAAVLQPGYCALYTRDGIEVVEPLTRRLLWTRRNVPDRTQLYGDARYIAMVETDASRKPVSVKLLRAVDGMVVDGSPDSGRVLSAAKSFQLSGHTALLSEGTGDQPRVLRLYDLATGKDIWKKEYDSKAVPIKSLTGEWVGYIRGNGEADVIEVSSGKLAATLKIDQKNLDTDLKPCGTAQLLADADRFYLFLDRDPGQPSTNSTNRIPIYNNTLRAHAVNGPLYAFDRATGKRLWNYGNGLFENQMLILEQFAELPVIIAAAPIQWRDQGGGVRQTYQVVLLEKARGKLIFERPVTYNGQFFHNLNVNLKNGTIDLNRFDMRIFVSPDDAPKQ